MIKPLPSLLAILPSHPFLSLSSPPIHFFPLHNESIYFPQQRNILTLEQVYLFIDFWFWSPLSIGYMSFKKKAFRCGSGSSPDSRKPVQESWQRARSFSCGSLSNRCLCISLWTWLSVRNTWDQGILTGITIPSTIQTKFWKSAQGLLGCGNFLCFQPGL